MWLSNDQLTGRKCRRIGTFSSEHTHVGLQIETTARLGVAADLTLTMLVGAADHFDHRHWPAGAGREHHEHEAYGDERAGEASRDVEEHLFDSGPSVGPCQPLGYGGGCPPRTVPGI